MTTMTMDLTAPSCAERLRNYLTIMYPPLPRLGAAGLMTLGYRAALGLAHGESSGEPALHMLLGAVAVFLFLLILRLMDELKDTDVDARLFPGRPLPSGMVRESDLRGALAVTTLLFLAVNIPMPGAFPFAVALLCYALLMFVWFFHPDVLKPNLLLTLATHNPVVGLMFLYLAAVTADEQGVAAGDLHPGVVAATVLQYWAMGFSWEISRKIRRAEEETAYVTYSQILGRRGALAVALGAQSVAAGVAIGMWLLRGSSPVWPALVAAAYGASVATTVRHLRSAPARSAELKEQSELFMLAVASAAVLEWLFTR